MSDYLNPSRAARRMACSGSHRLENSHGIFENTESMKEGILAHEIAAKILKNAIRFFSANRVPPIDLNLKDTLDSEIDSHAKAYADYVKKTWFDEVKPINHWHKDLIKFRPRVEKPIRYEDLHLRLLGKPDCYFYHETDNEFTIHIFELKYGHRQIEIENNWQMIEYAFMVLKKFDKFQLLLIPIMNKSLKIKFHIFQPRAAKIIQTLEISELEFEDLINRLVTGEVQVFSEFPQLQVSEHCIKCSARHACPALQRSAHLAVELQESFVPAELTNAGLSSELQLMRQAEKYLNARITGLEVQALHALKKGEVIPGFTLDQSAGRKIWNNSVEEIIELGKLCDIDLEKKSVLTPLQAIEAGIPEDVVESFSSRKKGELKLVEVDPRKLKKLFEA